MASGGTFDCSDLVDTFNKFCTLSDRNAKAMTSKAVGRLVKDCWEDKYKKEKIKTVVDSSAFPQASKNNKMEVTNDNIKLFITKTATGVILNRKGLTREPKDEKEKKAFEEEVHKEREKLKQLVTPPKIEGPKTDAKVVDRLTDASKYTGAHKERFDKEGKGKGIEGRADRTENTGYTGQYKNKDTYDSKHK